MYTMCVDDILRTFQTSPTLCEKLGVYYGVYATYVVFRKLEYIASGPLHILSTILQDALRDSLSRTELEDFYTGLVKSIILCMQCPAFHNRTFRKVFLRQSFKIIQPVGEHVYTVLIIPRLRKTEIDTLRQLIEIASNVDGLTFVDIEKANMLNINIPELICRAGVLVYEGKVYLPVRKVPEC